MIVRRAPAPAWTIGRGPCRSWFAQWRQARTSASSLSSGSSIRLRSIRFAPVVFAMPVLMHSSCTQRLDPRRARINLARPSAPWFALSMSLAGLPWFAGRSARLPRPCAGFRTLRRPHFRAQWFQSEPFCSILSGCIQGFRPACCAAYCIETPAIVHGLPVRAGPRRLRMTDPTQSRRDRHVA